MVSKSQSQLEILFLLFIFLYLIYLCGQTIKFVSINDHNVI